MSKNGELYVSLNITNCSIIEMLNAKKDMPGYNLWNAILNTFRRISLDQTALHALLNL